MVCLRKRARQAEANCDRECGARQAEANCDRECGARQAEAKCDFGCDARQAEAKCDLEDCAAGRSQVRLEKLNLLKRKL